MSAEAVSAAVAAMAATLAARGPDDSGQWLDPAAGIALGHRRLAVLDLSPTGRQPMASACGRFVLVYNGEIYNFRSLKGELRRTGIRFRGSSDTEVLLAGVVHWGLAGTLARADGMFALALWDREARTLYLARDRFGEKPLYYGRSGAVFLFASELKALRAHPGFSPEIDRQALAAYLRFGYVPAPWSIYRGVRKLPPAHYLSVSAADGMEDAGPIAYWSAAATMARARSRRLGPEPKEAVEHLDRVLAAAVASRMVSDVPLGAFLSGGIDSSTVVALMQAQSATPVRTFSVGFQEAGFNEAEHARRVAEHLGTVHTEIYVSPEEAVEVVPRLPRLYDEPFADSSQIPMVLVAGLARRSVTVVLSGDGGDELLGGYNRHVVAHRLWPRLRHLPARARRMLAHMLVCGGTGAWLARPGARSFVPEALRWGSHADRLNKLARLLRADNGRDLYRSLVSQWTAPAAVARGAQEVGSLLDDEPAWRAGSDLMEQFMYMDTLTYLPDDILTKVDRATMGASLEARVPFLSPEVVELAWRLPPSLRVQAGQGKWLLRRVLDRYVPRSLVDRPKMGFAVPIGEWLRGRLRDWAEELLDGRRLAGEGYLEPSVIADVWQAHLAGREDASQRLWTILMFQSWLAEIRP